MATIVLERQSTESVFRCYADARLVAQSASAAFSHIAYDTDMITLIGAIEVDSPWQFWSGGIDDLRIYNRALSAAEVAGLFWGGPAHLTIEVSQVRLCWDAPSNQTFQLQYKSELTTNTWVDLGLPLPGNAGLICTNDAITQPRRFYRVLVLR